MQMQNQRPFQNKLLKPANESQEQKAREIGGEKRAWQSGLPKERFSPA
jgi:hypothetical protein